MGETELVGVQLGLRGRLMHPPAHGIVRKQQAIEFLIDQERVLATQRLLDFDVDAF